MNSRTYDSAFANLPSSLFSRLFSMLSMLSALCPMRMTSRLSYILLGRSSGVRPLSSLVHRPSSLLSLLSSVIFLLSLTSCGGGSSGPSGPSNVGGGYTLQVSGGTLNDGTATKGLVVLATLRDDAGNGPGGTAGWTITITGPGISVPLTVNYDDGSSGSYIVWIWNYITPPSGTNTYTARATNGTTTLTYTFNVNATTNLSQPTGLIRSGNTISWNLLTGAGSYYYSVTDGTGASVAHGVLPATTASFTLSGLPDGSYLVEVYAHTNNLYDLGSDPSPSPALLPQENTSLAILDFIVNGSYALDARGGVLYEGEYPTGTPHYGLVIWSSILTTTATPTPPAGDWVVSVTGPGITTPIVFTYPRTDSQYVYWDFGIVPVPAASGTYTVTATPAAGGTLISQTFTITNPTSQLPVATGLTATPTNGGGATISWTAVAGANSYYVNVWTDVNGVYTEVAGRWVTSTSTTITNGTLTKGVAYDVYVTACQLNMTDTTSVPPTAPGAQVDMSDTTFTYATITAQ